MEVIIGDIHGCYDELMELLDKISPSSTDRIISVGDVVDRGPNNRKVLEFFASNPLYSIVKGNHERKHLLISKGHCRPALSQIIAREEIGDHYDQFLELVPTLPNYLELDSAIIVHGSVEPGIELAQQKEVVLLGSMSGQKYLDENYDKQWYELADFEKPIIFGHKSYTEPFVYKDRVYGIDTNCCRGGSLTAITLPDFKLYSVKSREDHWTTTRQNHQRKQQPDVSRAYDNLVNIANELKLEELTRKELADKIKSAKLPALVFKAYDGKLTREDLVKAYNKIPDWMK